MRLKPGTKQLTFIDLFAGIGGMRLPFTQMNCTCVFSCEIDRFAQKTYFANFGEVPVGDIRNVDEKTLPQHDILLAGFPYQPFSNAGLKKGFNDPRGILYLKL